MENLFTIRVKHSVISEWKIHLLLELNTVSVSLYSDLLRCKLIINTCFIVGWLCKYQ